jgi:putative tryptophan/tyrosine transport system substrate-binding protein
MSLRRRDFITLLGGAAAAWPLAARAQQPVPVIGFLHAGVPTSYSPSAFLKGLSEAGYVEGRNVAIEYRWANNDNARLPELAADLVRRRVTVIATPGSSIAARAAKALTAAIPIVFGSAIDPVQEGLVASLNRPGGNVTGINSMTGELGSKQLALLRELMPGAVRIAALVNPNTIGGGLMIRDLQAAAAPLERQIVVVTASAPTEIYSAFASAAQERAEAMLVTTNALFGAHRSLLAVLAARHALPTIYTDRIYPEAGGLVSYGSSVVNLYRQAGIYTGRVLKGEKPADLPVMQETKFELVINLQVAKALDIAIPATLLAIADEVIE